MFLISKVLQAVAVALVALSFFAGLGEGFLKKELIIAATGVVLFAVGRFAEQV